MNVSSEKSVSVWMETSVVGTALNGPAFSPLSEVKE
jgi:hypothetical protein